MALFDDFDARTAEAVGRVFEDQVVWRPMLPAGGGGWVQQARPDPARPIRNLPAIISWAPIGLPVEGSPGGGTVGTASLMIDFQFKWFEQDGFETFGMPRRGDWIELPSERVAQNRMVEITRVGDDGSARFWAWCSLVTPDAD
jgi:hypothetical protein